MQVTVTGGTGHAAATLVFPAKGLAAINAQALAANIDANYATAIYYDPSNPVQTPSPGYLIVRQGFASNVIDARGFGAIVDENNGRTSTVVGGDNPDGQIVLAGDGGLTFSAASGPVTVAAGGGDNRIDLSGDSSGGAVYTARGNDTIFGGGGNTTISAGLGNNTIFVGAGNTLVDVVGSDVVALGAGSDTIEVSAGGGVFVQGAASVSGPGFSLTFQGGQHASTVLGGAGSYSIQGGIGGGVFTGGSAGGNFIEAGKGAVTITGGGNNDTLIGGSGADQINAGLGNETLQGGHSASQDIFGLTIHAHLGAGGFGTTDSIADFQKAHDLLSVGDAAAVNYALNTYEVSGGSASFLLEDGTKVVLQGFTGHLTSGNFT